MKKIVPGLVIGGICAVVIFLTQAVFPRYSEDDMWMVLAAYLFIFLALFAAGFWHKITGGTGGGIRVGSITDALIFVIMMATYALVDNLYLPTVSREAEKIWGFRQSHYSSMRAYLNWSLLKGLLLGLPLFAFFGAVFGGMGGVTAAYFSHKRKLHFSPMIAFLGRFLPFAAALSAIAFIAVLTGLVKLGYQLLAGWVLATVTVFFIFVIVELLRRAEKRQK